VPARRPGRRGPRARTGHRQPGRSGENLDEEVDAIANQLSASAPHALAGILDAVLIGGDGSIDAGLEYETQTFALCFSTADMREGTSAFLERRKPDFSGNRAAIYRA
jgi:enoyl-CoA hydratase